MKELVKQFRELSNNEFGIKILIVGLFIVIFIKNSNEEMINYKISLKNNILVIVYMCFGIFLLNQISEFLYFNF